MTRSQGTNSDKNYVFYSQITSHIEMYNIFNNNPRARKKKEEKTISSRIFFLLLLYLRHNIHSIVNGWFLQKAG